MSTARDGSRHGWAWLVAIVAVGAALRLYGIGADPFWLDEAHSANFTRLSFGELWSWSDPFDRGNPPGYIVLLKLWAQVSRSDAWLRTFSALAGIATLPLVYLVGRRISSHRTGLVATAFLAFSGYHIRFSQEARTYALMGLVAAVVMLAVAQLITQPDGDEADRIRGGRPWRVREDGLGLRRPLAWTDLAWPAYTLFAGVAFLLHVTGLGMAVAANLTVLAWWLTRRPKPPRFARNWIVANLGVLIIWLAWIPGFMDQLRTITADWWVPSPTLLSVAEGGADLIAPSFGWDMPWNGETWGAVILVVVGLVLVGIGTRWLALGHRVLIWTFLLTLPAIELAYSLRRPIFLTRTIIWLLIPLALGLALAALRPRRWWPATTALLLVVSLFGGIAYHATHTKTAWDEAVDLVAATAGPEDLVLIQPANTVVAFNHYAEPLGLDATVYGVPNRIPGREATGSTVVESDHRQVAVLAPNYEDVWLILNRPPEDESLEPTLEPLAGEVERHRLDDLVVVRFQMP
ncbi:MAG TPA: glycosyltransferase family 39 protein [Acidimicrobiia bacterium]|nr:glycosyltransferase family 39 protein [Acidimicrobiia bacterium]